MLKRLHAATLFRSIFLAVTAMLFAVSCGSQRTFQSTSPTTGLAKYVVVEVPDFKTPLTYVPADAIWRVPNELAEKLEDEDVFAGVSRSPVELTQHVLIVKGTIVGFDPPTWYEQAVGTIKVRAEVRFIDKADNIVVAEATFEGAAKGGSDYRRHTLCLQASSR